MSDFLTSGSAVERAMICPSSVALPHVRHETEWNARGTVIHEYLEAVSAVGRDAALAMIADPNDREVCDEIDLTGLEGVLGLAAEVSLAYNVATGTARELGRGAGRAYGDVGIDEVPCTLDVLGETVIGDVRRGFVADYKAGFRTQRAARDVVQLDFGALASARAYNFDLVEVQLIQVREGIKPWIDRRVIEGFEIDMFAELIHDKHAEWKQLRAEYDAGIVPKNFTTGSHCDMCAAREFCPAQSTIVRGLLVDGNQTASVYLDALGDAELADLWRKLAIAQSALSNLKKRMIGLASSRAIKLGDGKPGHERWLTAVISEGRAKLDGEHVFDLIATMHDEDVATLATTITTTKELIDSAIKTVAPRGKKAGMLRDLYAALEKIPGAIVKKAGIKTAEIELPSGERPRLISRRSDEESDPE